MGTRDLRTGPDQNAKEHDPRAAVAMVSQAHPGSRAASLHLILDEVGGALQASSTQPFTLYRG